MKNRWNEKSVVIIGAGGGLGSSFAKCFAAKGAKLLLVGRNEEKLKKTAECIDGDTAILSADITNAKEVERLADFMQQWSPMIDIVVNASGCDVRKPLENHSFEDIQNCLSINLLGAILITKSFLPCMTNQKDSMIVHIGGFADGRMAFPYYSVDVASRAGLFSFVESMNRELDLEGKRTRLSFFCPSPADTEAERPFHTLWQEMGISIVQPEEVAEKLVRAIEKKRQVYIMGGSATVIFSKLNAIMPRLADRVTMKRYGKMLQQFLQGTPRNDDHYKDSNKRNRLGIIAVILVVLSFSFYALIAAVPFLPFKISQKAMIISTLILSGEITWWIGVAIAGKQIISKYKKCLNPCHWFSC